MRKLDEGRRAKIFAYINSFYDESAAPPSVREIAEGTGLPVATVHRYLVDMKQSGELGYDGRRSINTPRIHKEARMMSAPVLGSVSCGPGQWEEEDVLEYIRLPESFYGEGEFYVLVAKGESMVDAGISPGDYVVIRKQNTAHEGDIVVALYDEGLNNLKLLAREGDRLVLRSCNADRAQYPDIPVETLQVQGVAVGVMHRFSARV